MASYSASSTFRTSVESGLATTIAAATATAGFIGSMRFVSSDLTMRLRALEIEFILTTAFTSAQEVGFDVITARGYSASPTNGTAFAPVGHDCKTRYGQLGTAFAGGGDIRTCDASAITAGTQKLDTQPFARGSFYCSAIGAQGNVRRYDFTTLPLGGILFGTNEGFIIRNTLIMGAVGVGKWKFSPEWDEGVLTA